MRCPECREAEMVSTREKYHYTDSGLPDVYLEDVEVRRCPRCRETTVMIPAIESLHRVIAHALIAKPHRFTGAEVKFLRKSLGWSQEDFAKRMGVSATHPTRWEHDEPMAPSADRLLRMLVVHEAPIEDYSVDALAGIDDAVSSSRLRIVRHAKQWRAEEAAA